ncbi:MAG: hypothetical protein C4293_02630 [Nitrospiraceae bacterium]
MSSQLPRHFLFVAGALRERDSLESAQLQLSHQVWGLRSALIRDNLKQYLTQQSYGLVYVLKLGICAQLLIVSEVLPFEALDPLIRDDLRTEARYGFVQVRPEKQWESSPAESLSLLQKVLEIPDQGELMRRLNLGMHGLTEEQYHAIVKALG